MFGLCLVSVLAIGGMCDPPSPNAIPADGGGGGGVQVFGPPESTKQVASVATSPSLLIQASGSVPVEVKAIVLFNSALIPSSVVVVDATPGGASFPPTPMVPAGIAPQGQIFRAVVSMNASTLGTRTLRASAAYTGDARRASRTVDLPVVPAPEIPVADPATFVVTPAGSFVANQIVVDLFPGEPRETAEDLAADPDVLATIVGFEPVTNVYVFELPDPGPSGPDALEILETALAAILSYGDLVQAAFPNFLVTNEATDIVEGGLSAAYDAANIPEAWAQVPLAAAANSTTPSEVRIGVIQNGLEAGNLNGSTEPHPELRFAATRDPDDPRAAVDFCLLSDNGEALTFLGNPYVEPNCPIQAPDGSDRNDIAIQLTNARENPCDGVGGGDAVDCPLERAEIDHGTFLVGLLGAINEAGTPAGVDAGTNGVLAFANGAVGADPVTGSDIPYKVLFAKEADESTATVAQMIGAITILRSAPGADVILLPFGWTRSRLDDDVTNITCADGSVIDFLAFDAQETTLRDAIESADTTLFVASAGNCNVDAKYHLPGGMESPPDNLLTVMATNNSGSKAGFSNSGASVHVGAPGVGVPGPIGYHAAAPSRTLANTGLASSTTASIATGTGTSVAAGLAAGVAGLYLSVAQRPISASDIAGLRDLLAAGGSDLGDVGGIGVTVKRLDALAALTATVGVEVDIAFVVDTTGSFFDDLDEFNAQANSMLNTLSNCGANVAVSISEFRDFPISPFGGGSDVPFGRVLVAGEDSPTPLIVPGTLGDSNVPDITAALASGLTAGGGLDGPESQNEALRQIATGAGLPPYVAAGLGGVGGPTGAFRAGTGTDARRIVVLWTDASFHDPSDPNDDDRVGSFSDPGGAYDDPGVADDAAYPPGAATGGDENDPLSACSALIGAGAKVITIRAGSDASLGTDSLDLAQCTDSSAAQVVDCLGNGTGPGNDADDLDPNDPLVCQIGTNGVGIANAIVATVEAAGSDLQCP
jgi:hypothetical protein